MRGGHLRIAAFLFVTLLIAGLAVWINLYASDEADRIVAQAPDTQPVAEEPPEEEIDAEACAQAQQEYQTYWDESIENPDDESYEEKLEVALTDVVENCGSV